MTVSIISVIARALNVDADRLNADSDSDSIGEWDSLAQVDLIAEIERIIGDRLNPREIARMSSIKSVMTVLESREIDVEPLDSLS